MADSGQIGSQGGSGAAVGDGVATIAVGNVLLTLWVAPATFDRWRGFVMPELDRLARDHPEGVLFVPIILPSSSPPDAAARAALQADLKRLGPRLLRLISVALGDSFREKIVRTMVRTMLLLSGVSKQQRVAATIPGALDAVLAEVTPGSLSRDELQVAVNALYVALGVTADDG